MTTAWTMERTKTTSETATALRVLLVEGHAECGASTALLLRMDGHDVRVAVNGPAALDEAQVSLPDVVLLDIGLPGSMDGYEVAKRLQEQKVQKRPLMIAVTGFGCEADRRQSAEVGIDLLLVKPADMNSLLSLLKRFQRILDR